MSAAPPAFFYVDPPGLRDWERVPVGATFSAVFAPEATTGHGWQRVTFRVVMARNWHGSALHRMAREQSAVDLSEADAAALWAQSQHEREQEPA